jgi:hypothetical protein
MMNVWNHDDYYDIITSEYYRNGVGLQVLRMRVVDLQNQIVEGANQNHQPTRTKNGISQQSTVQRSVRL